ncbi:flavin monoamine oxidase family protein [Ancylobacter terrae]|uniref:flavin monoamine oxidase family protein n=1 Tax=Ancylobacter sp. sgz301288 TaxID=3342077 RepID=UPI00385FA8D7
MSATAASALSGGDAAPVTMFGPDFPFAFDSYLAHPSGLGALPAEAHGREVAIIGAGISGIVAAFELMKLGLRPVVYEADRIGGRLRSEPFRSAPETIAELGAMRFPPSATTFFHYLGLAGLATTPFPNPLSPATPSTVIDLGGQTHYARTLADLPPLFAEVAQAWREALEEGAQFSAMQAAIRARDARRVKEIWNALVPALDEESFYGFIARSNAFRTRSYRHREVFGQVGFGTGGWDTDFPNSMLEILRVVYTDADTDHRMVVGGVEQLPRRLWALAPARTAHWPAGVSLAGLHGGSPRPGVARIARAPSGRIAITDRWGHETEYDSVVATCQTWLLSARIECEERLFSHANWMAMDRSHYMQAAKTFIMVDRPFWRDVDPATGRHVLSLTLSDRMTRGTYLIEQGEDRPGVICLSYAWEDDAMKWMSLPVEERVRLALHSLRQVYPDTDIRSHIIGEPITVSWESDPNFMGAFKGNLPGHYRYQRRLFAHFRQDDLPPDERGIFLAGDDISWTAGWAEGAVTTALNAVWGVMRHFGGTSFPDNPGPGDAWEALQPLALPE